MATALSTTILSLEQLKQDFCDRHAHLSEQHRHELWNQLVSLPSDAANPTPSSLVDQTPRSMSNYSSDMSQSVSSFGAMARNPSASMTSPMRRSVSRSSTNYDLQRSGSNASSWQSSFEEQSGAYSLCSDSMPMHSQPSLQPIAESTFPGDGMVEYTPDEYINAYMNNNGSSPLPIPHNPRRLQVQLTPSAQWSPPLDGSTSPSTPSTALMTPVTQSSNFMSRQGSCNPQYFDQTQMLRIHSDSSSMYPVLSEDGSFSFPSDVVESKAISNFADNSHFLSHFTGPSSETFFSTVPVSSASASALASSDNDTSDLAEDMRRSTSSSSESDASSASACSINSRHARREREINAQATRCKIAPKADPSNETKSASSNAQMMRIRSEDGSSKQVGVISKTPYIRPQHPKIMCPHCNERPNGFRGTHELERHVSRAHTARRKGFICIDASADKKFLANCKHCRNKKVYGAYYNAAAHLRRAHFHPRKRGRKGKGDEKRGGIGGGDDPPMDYLKQHWIRDIEVENKTAQSPDDGSDSAEPADFNTCDAKYDMDTSYSSMPQPQQPNDTAFMPMDSNQFVDYSMCMNYAAGEPYSATSDINDFQFDACRTF